VRYFISGLYFRGTTRACKEGERTRAHKQRKHSQPASTFPVVEGRLRRGTESVMIPSPRFFDSMAQAIMDPEEVRRFAKELKRFNEDIQTRASSLQARFAALGSTWQDQEHAKFAEDFVMTMKVLKKFVDVAEKHTPFLLKKAQRIDDYLDQR
jgi:uncharacterized protein YukE